VAASGGTRYLLLVHDKYAKHDLARKDFEHSLAEEDENFSLTRRNPELKANVSKAHQDLVCLCVYLHSYMPMCVCVCVC